MTDRLVLIVGAGPTGLVLALWLTKLGVRVRIIDKTAEAGTTSQALAVQARTLELYRQVRPVAKIQRYIRPEHDLANPSRGLYLDVRRGFDSSPPGG